MDKMIKEFDDAINDIEELKTIAKGAGKEFGEGYVQACNNFKTKVEYLKLMYKILHND